MSSFKSYETYTDDYNRRCKNYHKEIEKYAIDSALGRAIPQLADPPKFELPEIPGAPDPIGMYPPTPFPSPPRQPFPGKSDKKSKKEKMPHRIWVCTPNDQDTIDHICSAIMSTGVSVSSLAKGESLYILNKKSPTTIIGIRADNFKRDMGVGEILNSLKDRLKGFDYYGMIVSSTDGDGGSSWCEGNIVNPKFGIGMGAVNSIVDDLKKEAEESIDQLAPEPEPDPEPEQAEDVDITKINMSLLLRVLNASTSVSDVFFDGISKQDRELLAIQVQGLMLEGITFESKVPDEPYGWDDQKMNSLPPSEQNLLKAEKKRDTQRWEVDRFIGENEGLVIAEVELESEDQHVPLSTESDFLKRAANSLGYHKANQVVPVQRLDGLNPGQAKVGTFRRSSS